MIKELIENIYTEMGIENKRVLEKVLQDILLYIREQKSKITILEELVRGLSEPKQEE